MFLILFSENDVRGENVLLHFERQSRPAWHNNYIPSVYFSIYTADGKKKVGECDLRLGMDDELYYAGNIGYRIYEPYRGHHYAYDACCLLLPVARDRYGMKELIVTCSPENTASRKTLERLNGTLVKTVDVPKDHWLYKRGEKVKNIYRFEF